MAASGPKIIAKWIPSLPNLLSGASSGMLLFAWSVFIKPLNMEFGWTRTEIGATFAIWCLIFGLTTFFSGRAGDKYGHANCVMAGAILLGIGYILSGFAQSKGLLYVTYGVIAGVGGGLIYSPAITASSRLWPDRAALTARVSLLGLGIGACMIGPASTWFVTNPAYGWRYAFCYGGMLMGLLALVSGLLLHLFSKGRLRAGYEPVIAESPPNATPDPIVKAILKDSRFRLLSASCFGCSFASLMVIGTLADLGRNQGLSAMGAAVALSVAAFAYAAARIIYDDVTKRIGIASHFAVLSVLQVAGLIMLYPIGRWQAGLWIAAALIGWSYGAVLSLLASLYARFYGSAAHDDSGGLLMTAWAAAGFSGSLTGALLRDATGDYHIPYICMAIVCAASALVVAAAKPVQAKTA
jgi:MFS transporter, OFA family, oxalate/formate antiporter